MPLPSLNTIVLVASILICSTLSVKSISPSSFTKRYKHIVAANPEQLEELKKLKDLSLVLYFTRESKISEEFLVSYDKAAEILVQYGVTLAVFDCQENHDMEICKSERISRNVFTYKNGKELVGLELETLFDVNSLVGITLQLAMLKQVTIIQSRLGRQKLQKSLVEKKQDLIFAYPKAFGTEGHRIFIELAYAYQENYKFAVSTEFKNTEGLAYQDTLPASPQLAVWFLFCSEVTKEELEILGDCPNILYTGAPTQEALMQFLHRLSEQHLYHAPKDGVVTLFNLPNTVPTIFVVGNKDTKDKTQPIIDRLSFELRGTMKIVDVDMDDELCLKVAESRGFSSKKEDWPQLGIRFVNGTIRVMEMKEVSDFLISYFFTAGTEVAQEPDALQSLVQEMEFQDDQVADSIFGLRFTKIDLDLVPALLKHNFYDTIKMGGLKMVLFYLPFDQTSVAFLRDYSVASQILAQDYLEPSALAIVNCYDATDLCAAENITTYPVIRIYRNHREPVEYMGALASDAIVKAVKLAQVDGPLLKTEKEVEKFMNGEHPSNFTQFTPSSVLLLAGIEDADSRRTFRIVAKTLSTHTAFGIVSHDIVKNVAAKYKTDLPAVLAQHRGDPVKPVRIMAEPISFSALTNFARMSTVLSVPELTASVFPTLFARKKPFAILFLDKSDPLSVEALETFTALALSDERDKLIYCWINAKETELGLKILSEYVWTASLPMITVVDHKYGEVFNYQPEKLVQSNTAEWINRVVSGQERPSKTLPKGDWGPKKKYYDYLAFIDEDAGRSNSLGIQHDYEGDEDKIPGYDALSDEEKEGLTDEELHQLHRSRLNVQERREAARIHNGKQESPAPSVKQEPAQTHSHSHQEL